MGNASRNNNHDAVPPSNVLPATEIVKNPNPRANENLPEKAREESSTEEDPNDTGAEITDGEDA